jgi:exopolysaccharide production protein ExoY
MATPDIFNAEVTYREEQLHPGGFAHAHARERAAVPSVLPIASFRYRSVKPIIDLLLVFLALPILVPLGLIVAAAIRLTSRGPVLFRHRRIGQFQQSLFVWKFRTMYEDSDHLLEKHLAADPAARREWAESHKLRDDPRVTPIGRLLRKTSLDEIPQLINVLAGEMSIVGPRPIVDTEKAKYGMHLPTFCYAVPGITGLWQVSGRCDVSYEERVRLDVYYVQQWSLWMELKIILKTVFVMVHREGAY